MLTVQRRTRALALRACYGGIMGEVTGREREGQPRRGAGIQGKSGLSLGPFTHGQVSDTEQ